MKIKYFKAVAFLIAVFFMYQINAQERVVKGVVTTFDSIYVIGATVKSKGTKLEVETDTLGRFTIRAEKEDKLKVSAKGFYNQNVKLEKQHNVVAVNLKIKPGDKNLNYAYGLTKVSDRDILSSLASKDDNDIDYSSYENMIEAIQGRFPGVNVINGQLIIRGNSTISGPSPALIVVDGMPTDQSRLNAINPVTVKRINVIKDGTSAIYGAKGANGVIEITTKSGDEMNY